MIIFDTQTKDLLEQVELLGDVYGYTKTEAIQFLQAQALIKLSDCIRTDVHIAPAFNVTGVVGFESM